MLTMSIFSFGIILSRQVNYEVGKEQVGKVYQSLLKFKIKV